MLHDMIEKKKKKKKALDKKVVIASVNWSKNGISRCWCSTRVCILAILLGKLDKRLNFELKALSFEDVDGGRGLFLEFSSIENW